MKTLLLVGLSFLITPLLFGQCEIYLNDFKNKFDQTQTVVKQKKMLLVLRDSCMHHTYTYGEQNTCYNAYEIFCNQLESKLSKHQNKEKLLPILYLCLANLYFQTDQHKNLEYAYKALERGKQQQDEQIMRSAINFITRYLFSLGLYEEVIPYLLDEERILQKSHLKNTHVDYISLMNTIAMAYQKTGNLPQAFAYYEKCLQAAQAHEHTAWIGLAYGNMAMAYAEQKNYSLALDYLKKDVKYSLLSKNIGSALMAWVGIAQMYQKLGENKKGSQAMESAWALLATIPPKDVKPTVNMVALYKSAYKFYKENKEFEKLPVYADSLMSFFENETKSKHNADLKKIQAQYNVKLKEQEVQALQKQKTTERRILYLLVVIALFVVAFAVNLFMNNRKQLKTNTLLQESKEEIESQNETLNIQKEQLAIQNETLQQLNETKNKLFSIVSHDFRSPLNALKATTYLMSREDITLPEIKELTLQAKNQINNTSYFLENLLFWAKSQFKGFQFEIEFIALSEILQENVNLILPQASQKGIGLTYQPSQSVEVLADRNMLRLVVRNLLSNAVKYCRKDDEIQVSYQIQNQQVMVIVQDSGIGMNYEQLQTLFTPLVSSSYGTNHEKGVGLGLMLCKDFVERNGGKIWVESEAGKGSTFFFTLPVDKPENEKYPYEGVLVTQFENGGALYSL